MKHKKSPKPPLQPIPSKNHADIAAGPSDPPGAELDVTVPGDGSRNVSDNDPEADHTDLTVPPNEGEMEGPQVPFQDETDVGQELPASGASTSEVAIGSALIAGTNLQVSTPDPCDGPTFTHICVSPPVS